MSTQRCSFHVDFEGNRSPRGFVKAVYFQPFHFTYVHVFCLCLIFFLSFFLMIILFVVVCLFFGGVFRSCVCVCVCVCVCFLFLS